MNNIRYVYFLYVPDEYHTEELKGVFSSYERAETYAKTHINGYYDIEEMKVDEVTE